MDETDAQKHIAALKEQIRDLKAKRSSCSTSSKMDFEILELEDELFELQTALKAGKESAGS